MCGVKKNFKVSYVGLMSTFQEKDVDTRKEIRTHSRYFPSQVLDNVKSGLKH